MAHEIKIPPFGESITESTVAQWLKADGEWVNRGDSIVTLDTEKASSDLQAEVSGRLKIRTPEGTDVEIGSVIGEIDEQAEKPSGGAQGESKPADTAAGDGEKPESAEPVEEETASELAHRIDRPTPTLAKPEKAKARTAKGQPSKAPDVPEHPHMGAVTLPVDETPDAGAAPAAAPAAVSEREGGDGRDGRETRRPMSRMRKTIAARLLEASTQTAMLTTFAEADLSEVIGLRKRFNEKFQQEHGIKLGFMSFFIKACVDALKAFPMVNSSIDGDDIVEHHYYDISVAVSTERGLVVPVVRDADQKSFAEIEKEIADLAGRAREGRLGIDEMKGGTFTITNGGIFGSMLSTPLLNPPQVGILGMHAIQERAVAVNGNVEIRPMMYLALSYDHRLIDGREAVQFLIHVRDRVAAPDRLLLGL